MSVVQIARNATVAKIVNPTRATSNFVANLLSYTVDQPGWSGKSSFYDVLSGTFPAGFTHVVCEELQRAGHLVQLVQKPLPAPLGEENPIVDEFGNDDPRYSYQIEALRQVERHGAGIIRAATGAGKSKICKLVIARYRRMTLFLTTRSILLYQMKEQLDAIGIKTGVIGDGEMTFSREVNLGMVQTFVAALRETSVQDELRALVKSLHLSRSKNANVPRDVLLQQAEEIHARKQKRREAILRFLSLVDVVIGEEAHEAGGDSYYEVLRHCRNARIRVALTATPFMRASAEDNMRLMAAFGPVLIEVSEKRLIDSGILAKPYFKFRDVPPPAGLHRVSPYERAYKLGYVENENMTRAIVEDAVRAKALGLPILTLVLRKKHGETLLKAMKAAGLNFSFLRGDDDQEERKRNLKDLAAGRIDGIIGTTILDVGVDVPAIGLVQLAGGGKAEVALRQRIGRGLRSKKNMPNVAFIIDYSCNHNHTLREHAKQREMIVRNTPGFAEGLLEDDEELPWWIFEQHMNRKTA